MILTALLLAAVGLSLGLIGGGGSVMAVPVLVYVAKVPPKEAIPISLLLVTLTSVWAGARYWKRGDIRPKLVLLFSVSGIAGSLLGSQWTHRVSDTILMTLFASLMAVIGGYMLWNISRCTTLATGVCRPNVFVSLIAGFLVGSLTGFLGVGGGFMIVPVLAFLLKCSMQAAIGTSLAIISVNSLFSFGLHHGRISLPMWDLLIWGMAMLGGAVLSSVFSKKIDTSQLARSFAVLIILAGILILLKTWF